MHNVFELENLSLKELDEKELKSIEGGLPFLAGLIVGFAIAMIVVIAGNSGGGQEE